MHAQVGAHEVEVVCEGVDGPAGSLVGRDRVGECRIEKGGHGKERGIFSAVSSFVTIPKASMSEPVPARVEMVMAGKKTLHSCLACKKVPGITIIKGRGAHKFRAVYDRAPATCQDDVDVFPFAEGSHAVDSGVPWIGFHTPASKRVMEESAATLLMFA